MANDERGGRLAREARVWLNGYMFALLLLTILGAVLIWGGTRFQPGSNWNQVLIGVGISMAPAAIVGVLFRVFLFKEVQYQLTHPVVAMIEETLLPELKGQVTEIIQQYRGEIGILHSLKEAGVIRPHRRRDTALKDFASAIDAETSEIMIIGSSLKGFLQMNRYKEISNKVKFKIEQGGVRVKFLLTHPVVADLRAGQEARRPGEIGAEIIESLQILHHWGVKPEDVRLYKGTPTCFAIRTQNQMLLNPYPYRAASMESPCIIVKTSDDHPSYFYDEFAESHFAAWETDAATPIGDFGATITELKSKIGRYSQLVTDLLSA